MVKNLKLLILIFGIVAFLAVSGCTGNGVDSEITENASPDTGADVVDSTIDESLSFPSASGAVVETMNAAGYTYIKIDTGSGEVWAAVMETGVEVGDNVAVSGVLMDGFYSPTLDQTFDEIIFADDIIISGELGEMNESNGGVSPHGGMPVIVD